jgi:transcriptional regulator with XRE-family HTH domain
VAVEMTGSTVPRRQLGRSLREARLQARMTVRASAKALEWSEAKMWRIETGQVSMRAHDVETMCRVYGVPDRMTEVLKGLAKETKARGWWHSYGDVIPSWFDVFVALEGAASEMRMYESELVPGLFQTSAYTRAVIGRRHPGADPDDLERRVLLRMHRQSLVTRVTDPTRLDVVLNEAVLRRPVGDRGVMAAQCRQLAELSELPNVTIRVVPFTAGWHLGCDSGPFTILRFPTDGDGRELEPPTVYVQGYTGALYLDQPREVAGFDRVFTEVTRTIRDESGERSRALIREAAREHGG